MSDDLDVRHLAYMPLKVMQLRDSELAARATPEEFRAAVMLWCVSWHQVPAGSLPDDDLVLHHYAGMPLRAWRRVKAMALHGFKRGADNRLHHDIITEIAIESLGKTNAIRSKMAGISRKRWEKSGEIPEKIRVRSPKTEEKQGNGDARGGEGSRVEGNRVIPSESHSAPPKRGKRAKSKREPSPRFELWVQTFITVYPKRGDEYDSTMAAIRPAYGRAINRADPDKINQQAAAYAAYVRAKREEPRFVLTAVKWLNQEGWTHDYSKPNRPVNGNGAGRKRSFDYLDDFERENGIVRDRDGGFTVIEPDERECEDIPRDLPRLEELP